MKTRCRKYLCGRPPASSCRLEPWPRFARSRPPDGEPSGTASAVTIFFNLAPGVSLGDAVDQIEDDGKAARTPGHDHAGFSGTAQVFQQSLQGQGWLLLATVIVIYIV